MNNDNDNLLQIMTVNCQGLGDLNKRGDVFSVFKKKNYQVYFLQDTHFIKSDENLIQTQWGQQIYFSSFRPNSRGVAILFNNKCEFSVNNHISDINGNYLILDCTIEGMKYVLVNLYGPNTDSPSFYTQLLSTIDNIHTDQHVIIAGDFNLVMDPELDLMNYKHLNNPKARKEVLKLMDELNLKDIFREMYPTLIRYSWRKRNPLKQARLDFFLISESLLSLTTCVQYDSSYRSDHSPAVISLKLNEFIRGKGFWKFNNSLLYDKDFVSLIKTTMKEVKVQYACPVYNFDNINLVNNSSIAFTINDQLFLDILLTEIRGKTISYSAFKKKNTMRKEADLEKEILLLEQSLNSENSATLAEKQHELENIRQNKLKGKLIRSKVKWIDEGEKPTRYFSKLESRNFISKQVPRIEKDDGTLVIKQEEILTETKLFYENLYRKRLQVEKDTLDKKIITYLARYRKFCN